MLSPKLHRSWLAASTEAKKPLVSGNSRDSEILNTSRSRGISGVSSICLRVIAQSSYRCPATSTPSAAEDRQTQPAQSSAEKRSPGIRQHIPPEKGALRNRDLDQFEKQAEHGERQHNTENPQAAAADPDGEDRPQRTVGEKMRQDRGPNR